jgi:hypothetical protein
MAMSWCPVFEAILESSVWAEPDHVRLVFLTMLFKKDHLHKVYGNAFNISMWSHKTETEVLDALKILSAPDTRRLEPQEFDGRRIEKVGYNEWLILNGAKYQALMVAGNERARKARWAAQKRAQDKADKQAMAHYEKNGTM